MLTLELAARLCGGRFNGADAPLNGVGTDSRQVRMGSLFVALRGERFDGHAFVADVLRAGAAGAMVADDFESDDPRLIRVADTRLALGRLASGWRDRFDVKVVGITGSNGKTTVKEMLAAILRAHAGENAVLATAGNFNNDIGLPLTLLQLNAGHQFAVIEMGMNHPGEIAYLTRLARPHAALVNNALRAHLGGGFNSTADIARAKAEIFQGLDQDGVALINADDAHADLFVQSAADYRQMSFGLHHADVRAEKIELNADGSRFALNSLQGQIEINLSAPGEHNVRNALAAASAALVCAVPLATIAAGLAAFGGVRGRLQRKTAGCGATLIDDTYNANPDSMKAGLDVLARFPSPRVFVMGDIGELGETADALHAEVGAYARQLGIERLLTLGAASKHAARAYGDGAQAFDEIGALLAHLDGTLTADATVLIKGSRFMRMERVVEHMLMSQDKG